MSLDTYSSGDETFAQAFADGLQPDPELWLDEWCEAHMRIPREISADYGQYRFDRTPFARPVHRWLSPAHPAQRIVLVAPSQLMKTQIALNAICGWIDAAPANILALEPTTTLAKRLSNRVSKTFKAIDKLDGKVAETRSRDARNTIDTKEFDGGTLYINTAGTASNLAEIMARYLYGDEIDRWEGDIDGEGDPVKLAENRTASYRLSRKMYYSSSPVRLGQSRIWRLYEQGTQNVVQVSCPHCGEFQELKLDALQWNDELTRAWMVCPATGCIIDEQAKQHFFAEGNWRLHAQSAGDGETESLHISAFYAPLGKTSWLDLAKEYVAAEAALEARIDNAHALMQVFHNTRLALPYSVATEVADAVELANRAEPYAECTVPAGGLVLTAGVDVQHDRLALIIRAFGRGEESWLVHWGEIHGQTLVPLQGAWIELEHWLFGRGYRHDFGIDLHVRSTSIDSGDGATQEAAYAFARKWSRNNVRATKGASERAQDKRELFTSPRAIDTDRKHKAYRYGLQIYWVGTNAGKTLLLKSRLPLKGAGPGRLHWYDTVRPDYWEQLTSEVEVPHKSKPGRKIWETKKGVRNEALDCELLALHAARALKTHTTAEHVWATLEANLRQAGLFAAPVPAADEPEHEIDVASTGPAIDAAAAAAEAAPAAPLPEPKMAPLPGPVAPAPTAVDNDSQWLPADDNWLN